MDIASAPCILLGYVHSCITAIYEDDRLLLDFKFQQIIIQNLYLSKKNHH